MCLSNPQRFWSRAGLTAALCVGCSFAGRGQENQPAPDQRAEIIHVLNRITFGPRPGDVEKVEKTGLRDFIEMQLHPEDIDDSKCDEDISHYDLLKLSAADLTKLFYDDTKRFLKNQKKLAAANAATGGTDQAPVNAPANGNTMTSSTEQTAFSTLPANGGGGTSTTAAETPAMAEPSAAGTQAMVSSDAPTAEAMRNPGAVQGAIQRATQWRSVAAIGQLEDAKLVRAVESNKQLQEVLVDFWENHFNVDVKKGPDRVYEIVEDRDVIRPHIWGKFRDLVEATAKSPAMLHYLDDATNTVQRTMSPMEQRVRARLAELMAPQLAAAAGVNMDPSTMTQPKKVGGINENYGRELMELHTIGVDAGYTQQDVQEVARCFTGWTYNRLLTGEFMFRPRQHDDGEKTVLGHDIPAGGGMQDGETVLDILCSSPACAHFISREMCQRFVSDNPPDALVNRVAGVFTQTQGDLRAVTEAILTSPEFLSPTSFGNKIKSPLEFAVSAVRASESTVNTSLPPPFDKLKPTLEGAGVLGRGKAADRLSQMKRQSLNWHVLELGEPLYACTPPTGYGENSAKWVSPGALIERLNFALALTSQQLSDVRFDTQKILAGVDLDHPEKVLDQCVAVLLQNDITDSTRKVLAEHAVPPPGESQVVNPNKLVALILGSPEFQRK